MPKPLAPKIVEAVRENMAAPKGKGHWTVYHKELLKLVAESDKDK